jgi:hypothetical protein
MEIILLVGTPGKTGRHNSDCTRHQEQSFAKITVYGQYSNRWSLGPVVGGNPENDE